MRLLCLLLALTALPFVPAFAEISGVVVVRHAEKVRDAGRDPGLTSAGQARAEALAEALTSAEVVSLITSQYRRTRQTLSVLARERGLDITVVPARSGAIEAHVDAVASEVGKASAEGVVVIAGHSNTVPLIVEALSGQAVAPIAESEYDRLYILLPSEGGMEVVVGRYGADTEQADR